jgi:hypothetical protein
VDCETISRLTADEAGRVTSQMCKVYLSLLNAPTRCWEREGVLRFAGEEVEGKWVTAWGQLVTMLGVASATARKALRWMHEEGIVGYYAGKNGVGIRIFINRAASSIGRRPERGIKNLRLVGTSTRATRTSSADTPFSDSYADREVLEADINRRAPGGGAEAKPVGETSPSRPVSQAPVAYIAHDREGREQTAPPASSYAVPMREIVERLRVELEPCLRGVAARAAAQSVACEMERTREWFEAKALPKAVRVAQRETYGLLRRGGAVEVRGGVRGVGSGVGRGAGEDATSTARPLRPEEVREAAEACAALFEAQGKSVEETVRGMSSERGGWLLPQDVPLVCEAARELAQSRGRGGKV